jgi:hypothetical protein
MCGLSMHKLCFGFIFVDAKHTHTQRKDKVVLFKKLREDLELIKAGTFETGSMQLVCLVPQGA